MNDQVSRMQGELRRLERKQRRSWIGSVLWWILVLGFYFAAHQFDIFSLAPDWLLGVAIFLLLFILLPVLGIRYLLEYLLPSIMWTWPDQRRLDAVTRSLAKEELPE